MRLVCALDDSPAALGAACLGAGIARSLDVELTLVHALRAARILPPPGGAPLPGERDGAAFARQAAAAIETYGSTVDLLAELTGARVALRIDIGAPVSVLARVVAETACDLLFVGHPRHGAAVGTIAPGVARRLAAEPPCPVAFVPDDASAQPPRRIVAGCHGPTASHAATATAGRLASALHAHLTLVPAVALDERRRGPTGWQRYDASRRHRRLARFAAGRDLAIELAEPSGGVATLAPMSDAAWIVLGAPAHGRVRRRFQRPAASRIVESTGLAVVVVPDAARA